KDGNKRKISAHTEHLECFQNWKELELRLKTGKIIDEENLRVIKKKEKYWQQICILVRVLGGQNLTFHGHGRNQKLNTPGNGNFLKFVEYVALFDPVMKEHLRKITDHETQVHSLGKNMQNELIQILANAIKKKIVEAAHSAKYFSIILDCTPDVSHVEQMTMMIHLVDMEKSADEDNVEVLIKEHFWGFVPLKETTGAFMTETILQELEIMSLSGENLRGQGYDNGSNMKGKDNGLQRRMMEINPRAFFVSCSAHSLNLVVNDAARCCLEASSFFDLVQRLYVFFSGSTCCWEILTHRENSLTVKPLSQTRCESRIDALKTLFYELGNIYDAVIEISDDTTFTGSSGNAARSDAEALANGLSKFKFVTSLILWYNILFEINLTSKQLQEKNLNIHSAIQKLQQTKNILEEFRSDEGFERTLHLESVFGFIYDSHRLQKKTARQIREFCIKLESALTHENSKDIDATDLYSELRAFSRRLKKHSTPEEVLKFVCENKLTDSFPNIFIALCILLALPVSVASGECSFSKLKLIKTYLRSTMVQERLVGFATMSIEHEIAGKLDLKELVTEFSKLKASKVMF
uniref:DUF4371 domain-containing protein n=1 Tax=Terrapene triunguis TaxID=2587831 RepID=A0A674JYR2_9SAUR